MSNYDINNLNLTINGSTHDLSSCQETEMVKFNHGQHYLYLKRASVDSDGKLVIKAETELCLCSLESKNLFESQFNS